MRLVCRIQSQRNTAIAFIVVVVSPLIFPHKQCTVHIVLVSHQGFPHTKTSHTLFQLNKKHVSKELWIQPVVELRLTLVKKILIYISGSEKSQIIAIANFFNQLMKMKFLVPLTIPIPLLHQSQSVYVFFLSKCVIFIIMNDRKTQNNRKHDKTLKRIIILNYYLFQS